MPLLRLGPNGGGQRYQCTEIAPGISIAMTAPVLHVVLIQPEIPQNAGSIARTCVAAGAKLWFVRPLGFRLDDRNVRRAGLDYWEHLDSEVCDSWAHLRRRLETPAPWFFSTRGRRCYTTAAYRHGDVLVFGPETRGLPQSMLDQAPDRTLRIPMRDQVRSLNLANAATAVIFEALRQIHRWPGPDSGI